MPVCVRDALRWNGDTLFEFRLVLVIEFTRYNGRRLAEWEACQGKD